MVLPGTGAHSPLAQSRTCGCASSSGVSCMSGEDPKSRTGLENASGAISLTLRANSLKISQSVLDSHTGGTAAPRLWINECRSVELRSFFSYQKAVGSTMSEYSAEESMRKL